MFRRIAIIGAGPAGCALACFLVQRGIECLVFDDDKKPSLLVGESLIPAAIPILRRLGIEPDVADISALKLGAALRHGSGSPRVDFAFQKLGKGVPEYAYNIPRPQFDAIIARRAQQLGARFIQHRAEVEACNNDPLRELQLSDQSVVAANLTREQQPDLLIDATGRTRLFSRCLKIPALRGPRNDVAHFAHFSNCQSDVSMDGQIIISVLDCGWSWQIPLADRTSIGVVLNSQAASQYGDTAADRLANVMRANAVLSDLDGERISEVKTYSNYQLIAQKAHGNGWVLLGDALGFVDPMLSPGVFLTLESATVLDQLIFKRQPKTKQQLDQQMQKYYTKMRGWHCAFTELIEYFYDGRLLSLGEMHAEIHASSQRFSMGKLAEPIISNIISRLISGAGTTSKFNQAALSHTCRQLTNDAKLLTKYSIKNMPATAPKSQ